MNKLQSRIFFLTICLFTFTFSGFAGSEIDKKEILSEDKKRSYYIFVPDSITKDESAPLLVLLHGSGRDGKILIEHWQKLAEEKGIILVGPDALNSKMWSIPKDAPQFIYDVVEKVKSEHKVDSRRVYLFGHSAGASSGLLIALLESEYFAATAVSAGVIRPQNYDFFNDATRKIPVALFVGDRDPLFPVKAVREAHKAFQERGFTAELTEIKKLDHNYYSKAEEINKMAWDFLSKYKLDKEPVYKKYNFN